MPTCPCGRCACAAEPAAAGCCATATVGGARTGTELVDGTSDAPWSHAPAGVAGRRRRPVCLHIPGLSGDPRAPAGDSEGTAAPAPAPCNRLAHDQRRAARLQRSRRDRRHARTDSRHRVSRRAPADPRRFGCIYRRHRRDRPSVRPARRRTRAAAAAVRQDCGGKRRQVSPHRRDHRQHRCVGADRRGSCEAPCGGLRRPVGRCCLGARRERL